jgi:hypothetical protein
VFRRGENLIPVLVIARTFPGNFLISGVLPVGETESEF